eukprot:6918869-Prymnesium_polylepis.1
MVGGGRLGCISASAGGLFARAVAGEARTGEDEVELLKSLVQHVVQLCLPQRVAHQVLEGHLAPADAPRRLPGVQTGGRPA